VIPAITDGTLFKMPTGNAAKQPVVCIFCASSPGKNPAHLASARDLSTSLSDAGYKLVYGGGTMGIMGEIAKTFVAGSGPYSVDGIIPRALIRTEKDPSLRNDSPSPGPGADVKQAERVMPKDQLKRTNTADTIPQSEFGNTIIVQDMHARKRMMQIVWLLVGQDRGLWRWLVAMAQSRK